MKRLFIAALLLLLGLKSTWATTTWNPSDKNAAITLSSLLGSSNLTATQNSVANTFRSVRSTSTSKHTGKWYFEVVAQFKDSSDGFIVGVGNASAPLTTYPGGGGNATGFQSQGSFYGGTGTSNISWTTGWTVGFAVDLTNNKMWLTTDGSTWSGGGNPTTNTSGVSITAANDGVDVMIMFSGFDGSSQGDIATLNVGEGPGKFAFPIPSGFSGWGGSGVTGTNVVTAATWDTSNKASSITLSGGNLTATTTTPNSTWRSGFGSDLKYSGKLYFEVFATTVDGSNGFIVGIASQWAGTGLLNQTAAQMGGPGAPGTGSLSSTKKTFAAQARPSGTLFTSGDKVGVAVDLGAEKIWMTVDGSTWSNSGNPAAGTGGYSITGINDLGVMIGWSGFHGSGVADVAVLNVGQTLFQWAIPSGFTAWDPGAVYSSSSIIFHNPW